MSNYEVVKGPSPASYAGNSGFGMQLGQMLGQLPDSYMAGRAMGQQRELEDMFKTEKLPRNPDGSVDVNNLIERGTKVGGFPFVMKMLPFLQGDQLMREANKTPGPTLGVGGDAYGSNAPSPSSAASPNNPPGQRVRTSSNGAGVNDDAEAPTLRSTVAEMVGGDTDATPQISAAARALRIDPDAQLTPDKAKLVKDFLGTRTAALGSGSGGAPATAPPGQNGNNAAPFMAGGASGSPGPTAGPTSSGGARPTQPTTTPAQAQLGQQPMAQPQRVAQATGQGTGLPTGYTLENAQKYEDSARRKSQFSLAADRSGNTAMAKSFQDQAAQDAATAKSIREKIAENASLTAPAKEARESGVSGGPLALEGAKAAQKAEITRGDNLQKGLQGNAREFETQLKPHLDAMRGILNDPNFVSGTGEKLLTSLNRIRSNPAFQGLPGYDPNAALPNEAIRKVMATAILNQTTQMKAEGQEMGANGGRLFQQQVSLMEKAAQDPSNTVASLRYLTELQTRMGDHSRAVAALASNYQGKYGKGVLDSDFDQVLSKYNNDHPIFTKAEIADQRLIAPPVAPAHASKEEARAWAEHAGLRPGDPVKTQSGKIVPYDPSKFK